MNLRVLCGSGFSTPCTTRDTKVHEGHNYSPSRKIYKASNSLAETSIPPTPTAIAASSATVNYPGASDTYAMGINKWGSIVGFYLDSSKNYQGYELKNSKYTRIRYPGSLSTMVTSISDTGVIVGSYTNSGSTGHGHGFILKSGVYKTLDNPKGVGGGTYLNDINASGVIVGNYFPNENPQGFIYINGTFKDIKAPNSSSTTVSGINGYGYVTGETTVSGNTAYTAHCQ